MASEGQLRLRIKTLAPAEYEVAVGAQATVRELKDELVAPSSIPPERQRLIYRGAVLRDEDGLAQRGVESGHVLHMVERPHAQQSAGGGEPRGQAAPVQAVAQQLNIGMVDVNGALRAAGGLNGLLQNLAGRIGGQQVQVVAHPPLGNQPGAAQVVQMMSVSGPPSMNLNVQRPPHQLAALASFLRLLDSDEPPHGLPPLSTISRLGQPQADEAAFLEAVRAVTGGQAAPTAAAEQGADAGGGDGGGGSVLQQGTAAVAALLRQAARHLQSVAMPQLAGGASSLQAQAEGGSPGAEEVQEQARAVSSAAYNAGCVLLELSLAAANLAQAAGGNASPLVCAQTGFLAPDGSHSHLTNRVPPPFPIGPLGHRPGGAAGQAAAEAGRGGRGEAHGQPQPGAPNWATALAAAGGAAGGGGAEGRPPLPPQRQPQQRPQRGMDSASPLAHAMYVALSEDGDARTRHMRMPVTLPSGRAMRLDLAPVVNAVETLVLQTPGEVLAPILAATRADLPPGAPLPHLRSLMLARQGEAQRRQVYHTLAHPILQAVFEHLRGYFQQVYRVSAPRAPDEPQPPVRPTRRAAARPVPSLTQEGAAGSNPAADAALRTLGAQTGGFPQGPFARGRLPPVPPPQQQLRPGEQPPGLPPGAQVHVEMAVQGPIDVPIANLLGATQHAAAAAAGQQQQQQQQQEEAAAAAASQGSAASGGADERAAAQPQPAPGPASPAPAAPMEVDSTAPSQQPQQQPQQQPGPAPAAAAAAPAATPACARPAPGAGAEGPGGGRERGGLPALPPRRPPAAAGAVAAAAASQPPAPGSAAAPGQPPAAAGAGRGLGRGLGAALGPRAAAAEAATGAERSPAAPQPAAPAQPQQPAAPAPPRPAQQQQQQQGGGDFMSMMSQMMQSPGVQQMLASPQLQQLAGSPAVAQLAGSMGLQRGQGRGGAAGGGPPPGMPDLGGLLQALAPALGGGGGQAGQRPGQQRPAAAQPRAGGAEAAAGGEEGEWGALAALPVADAARWKELLRRDRRAQQQAQARPASEAYRQAMPDPASESGGGPLGFLGLD